MMESSRAISVHDRLLNRAHATGEDFNLLLTRYSLERFLYRISISEHKGQFLLKGALLFDLWFDSPHRPTRDMDLLGFGSSDMTVMTTLMQGVCSIKSDDGLIFLGDSVKAHEIRDNANYGGIRIDLLGMLGNARCSVQIDIGFGDAVTPNPIEALFPTILKDNPAPILGVYPKETVIAEKLDAIVSLGMANSRMKDYFDLYILFRETKLDTQIVSTAIAKTFERRGTLMPGELPVGLSDEFSVNTQKVIQWRAFLQKNGIKAPTLIEVVEMIRRNAEPMLANAFHPNRKAT